MADIDLKSEESRRNIARRLRGIADNIEYARVTPDSFDVDIEWKDTTPTGRVFVKLGYWVIPANAQ